MRAGLLLAWGIAMPGLVYAEAPPAPAVFDPLTSSYLIKLVMSLILVLALMFAVIWLLKRAGQLTGVMGRYRMAVLAQISVGSRERVVLIEVGDRQLLVGVAQGQIESLGWVDPPLLPQTATETSADRRPSFAQLLARQADASQPKPTARDEGSA
ncbi:flagellar biosynthetic protein FliO [Halothiobacillus sp. DCM-1]|uniref:flagellar biosynthetic protein FliO n=1 Tax=Halothiobacillus sp. DCM-1 TaxID=3112558 RepID=UPI003249F887